MTNEIKALEARVEELRLQLDAAKKLLTAAKIEASGVVLGDVVVYRGVQHRVTKIDPRWSDKPWLSGNPMKKDGTFGIAERHLYGDWVKP